MGMPIDVPAIFALIFVQGIRLSQGQARRPCWFFNQLSRTFKHSELGKHRPLFSGDFVGFVFACPVHSTSPIRNDHSEQVCYSCRFDKMT